MRPIEEIGWRENIEYDLVTQKPIIPEEDSKRSYIDFVSDENKCTIRIWGNGDICVETLLTDAKELEMDYKEWLMVMKTAKEFIDAHKKFVCKNCETEEATIFEYMEG